MMGQAILTIVLLAFFIAIILFMIYDLTEVNVLKNIWKFMKRVSTPKTSIDKEIAEEEKEIAELERQKEKMDKLSELRHRKERLFRDFGEEQRMMCTCGKEFHSIDNYKEHLTNCFES